MGKKIFTINLNECNGCYCCQIGCKDEHVSNDWTPIAKPQPEIDQFWIKLEEKIRGTVPKVMVSYRPHMCMHCDNAPCMESCPVEGAIYKREDGMVIIDPVKCTGCRNCSDTCPYDVVYFNEDLNIAQKCTGCAHLLDDGWEETRCTDNCPTLCMRVLEEDSEEAKEFMAEAEYYMPEVSEKTKPRVYYKGLPKKFIAGTLFDEEADEVHIGAECTLTGAGATYNQTTDEYGDFWFEHLPDGVYDLELKAAGRSKSIGAIDATELDVNLGDIAI